MLNFFLNTRLGQSLLLTGGIAAAVGLTYWLVSSRAYDRGYAACQAEKAEAIGKANLEQAGQEQTQREGATDIAKASDTAAADATRVADALTNHTNEVIHETFREPPHAQPAAGSCVRPVERRVQDRLDAAVDSANRP